MTNKALQDMWTRISLDTTSAPIPDHVWTKITATADVTGVSVETCLHWLHDKRKELCAKAGKPISLARVVHATGHLGEELRSHGSTGKATVNEEEIIRYTAFLNGTLTSALGLGADLAIELYRPTSVYPPWFRVWKCKGAPEVLDEYREAALRDGAMHPIIFTRVQEGLNAAN